ncbi:hypothetical protein [Actinoplanes sp. NPDC051851]|uniref:tautomerase family protein n=1 Tax=Actinoplanes sp. NPDC051851 TaxID=3154753 RepID=UPI00343D4507
MPHLTVHILESDLTGREPALITGLTEAVVAVYGEWVRGHVDVRLIGLPPHRWGVGGVPAASPAPSVTFGIREAVFARPDGAEVVARLVTGITDAIAGTVGEHVRPGVAIEFAGQRPGRMAVGGVIVE